METSISNRNIVDSLHAFLGSSWPLIHCTLPDDFLDPLVQLVIRFSAFWGVIIFLILITVGFLYEWFQGVLDLNGNA